MSKHILLNANSIETVQMPQNNSFQLVCAIIKLLLRFRIKTCLFGGWAEEINGRFPPRKHKDIDLIHFSNNFENLDAILKLHNDLFHEIVQKKTIHKRAFTYQGVLVEVFLVNLHNGRFVTNFQNTGCFNWPENLFWQYTAACGVQIPVASIATLDFYRNSHQILNSKVSRIRTNNGADKSI